MKKSIRSLFWALVMVFSLCLLGQNVYAKEITVDQTTFPDANMRKAVLRAAGIYDESITSAVVDTAKISRVSASEVKELKGIELLDSLKSLSLWDYNGKTLKVEHDKLSRLVVYGQKLTSLNISKLSKLEDFGVSSKSLSKIDLTKNKALKDVSLYTNKIKTVKLNKATKLQRLCLCSEAMGKVDLSKNSKIKFFKCILK